MNLGFFKKILMVLPLFFFGMGLSFASSHPSILFVGSISWRSPFFVEPEYQKDLEQQGYNVGYSSLEVLTEEKLKRFNCVVLLKHSEVGSSSWQLFRKIILPYVQEGGGVLIFSDLFRGRVIHSLNKALEPLGAKVVAQKIEEKNKDRISALPNHDFKAFLTQEILPSPLTKGLSEIWFPLGLATWPLELSQEWKVAIRAGKTTQTTYYPETKERTILMASPPIIGYRKYGKGRIVIFSSESMFWVLNPNHFFFKGFFLKHGGEQLLLNIYSWLSEPSLKSGTMGGFTPKEQREIYTKPQRKPREVFSQGYQGKMRKGIIGVHSTYSGGKYTIAEFCKAARKLGYDFLVFTEDGKKINDPKVWKKYVEECRRNTDDKFVAIPGVQFTGLESGNEGIIFNLLQPWPQIPWDGKGFNTYIRLGVNNRWSANLAQIHPGKNSVPFYILGTEHSQTLFTYQGKKLVDDYSSWFLRSNAGGWYNTPITYHNIWNPEELKNLSNTYHTYFCSSRWGKSFHLRRGLSMVSNGPLIERFRLTTSGPRVSPWEGKVKIRIKISSPSPLKRVKVYFNWGLIRCFYPEKRVFEKEIDYYTNQTGYFYLIAEDSQGNKAYSKSLGSGRDAYHAFIGTDKMNGYWYPRNIEENSEILGGLYPGWGWGPDLRLFTASQTKHPVGVETGNPPGGVSAVYPLPQFYTREGDEFIRKSLEGRIRAAPWRRFVLNSTDCIILKDNTNQEVFFWKAEGREHFKVINSKFLESETKVIGFRWKKKAIRLLIETEAWVRNPVQFLKKAEPNPTFLRVNLGDKPERYGNLLYLSPGGKIISKKPAGRISALLPKGGYVRMESNAFGTPGVFTFQKSKFTLRGTTLSLGDDCAEKILPAGVKISRKYLFILTQGGEKDNPEEIFPKIYDLGGFDGTPGYQIKLERGKVKEKIYAPLLETEGFYLLGKISAATLPNPLGLIIEGLNPNWDAGVYDLEKNKLIKRVAISQDDGRGYLALDISRSRSVFIGNLIIADNKNVKINVLKYGRDGISFLVHNPTPERIEVTVKTPLKLKGVPVVSRSFFLSKGETVKMDY